MALRDDLENSESYYIVEIRSLQRILDKVKESKVPVLCFIDEVLRGTNTLERIASSSEILAYLAGKGAMCFAEHVDEEDVLFDYRLREGAANTRNAIKLLNMIGYDKVITYNAEKQARDFLKNGLWKETE